MHLFPLTNGNVGAMDKKRITLYATHTRGTSRAGKTDLATRVFGVAYFLVFREQESATDKSEAGAGAVLQRQ